VSLKSPIVWLAWIMLAGSIAAHEGHKPLPTTGVEIEPQSGTLVLSASARDALAVKTEEVTERPVRRYLHAFGRLVVPWNNHALVGSSLEGRVVSISAIAGQGVQIGQSVAEIESPKIESFQREIRDLIAGLRLDQQLLQGAQEASTSGAIPMARLLELQASLFQRETALTIAKAKWRGLGLEGSDFERMVSNPDVPTSVRLSLRSPISGTILHTDLTVGKFVNLKEHILEVIDLSRLWLRIDILEKDISRIQVGDPVEFFPTSGLGKPIAGSLGVIEKSLDPVTHLATAWVDLPMDTSQIASLLPGMTGQVKIGTQSTAARLSIPKSALVRDGAERFVLVEQERNAKASVFRKIPLAIGEQSGGICEVTRGELVPGDRVLTQGSRQLGHLFTQGVLKLSPEAAVDIGLKTQKVEPLRVSRTLSVDGVVSLPPSRRARVSPQLSGRVHQILIDRSATVRKGQALALLSSPEFQDLQLDCIQANLGVRFRESVLRNIRQGGTSIPHRQRIETENQLASARNQLESLVRQLRLLGIGQEELEAMLESQQVSEHYRVLAPIDGIVVGFHQAIGHIVSADEEMFEIHDNSERLVEVFVSEKDASLIRQGQTLRCRSLAEEDRSYPGRVISSGQSLSNRGQTLSVWAHVQFEDDSMVFYNMLCRISIDLFESSDGAGGSAASEGSIDKPESLAIPWTSILQEGSQTYVFVALTDGLIERRLVLLGRRDDLHVEVLSGLRPFETVVVQGVSALQTGFAAIQ